MPHYILVEGKDDKILFDHLLKGRHSVELLHCEGQTKLPLQLEVIKNQIQGQTGRSSIMIVFDAEGNMAKTLSFVQQSLAGNGFDAPTTQDSWTTGVSPVLIHLIPGAGSPGCLEDLFLTSIEPERTQEFGCLKQLRTCWPDTPINDAKWSKLFASVLLRTTPGTDDRGVGNALTGDRFRHLLTQEPFVQLARVLALIPPPPNA